MRPSIQVVIPTCKRPAGLKRMLDSVSRHSPGVECLVTEGIGPWPIIANALFAKSRADIVIWAGDSCEWTSDVAGLCTAAMLDHFPDLDGCIGIHQENLPPRKDCHEFCFMAVGRRFIEHFPCSAIFNPAYEHFWPDTELGLFAKSLGKFFYETRATCIHYMPQFSDAPVDETYKHSRCRINEDHTLREWRKSHGYLWGTQFGPDMTRGVITSVVPRSDTRPSDTKPPRRLVFQAVVGNSPVLDLTEPFTRAYADRIGAECMILRDNPSGYGEDKTPHWVKLHVDRLLEDYDQVLWIDADVLVRKTAPSIFEAVPEGLFGAWFAEGAANSPYRPGHPMYRHGYFNSGVMLFPKAAAGLVGKARDLFLGQAEKMTVPEQHYMLWDQTPLNKAFEVSDLSYKDLDIRWNHYLAPDRCVKHGFAPVEDAWFVHFAGGGHIEHPRFPFTMENRYDQTLRARLMSDWMEQHPEGLQ